VAIAAASTAAVAAIAITAGNKINPPGEKHLGDFS